jgi:hypothetical protein
VKLGILRVLVGELGAVSVGEGNEMGRGGGLMDSGYFRLEMATGVLGRKLGRFPGEEAI